MAIGGNITATVQVLSKTGTNAIGEAEYTWEEAITIRGWLDYVGGGTGGSPGRYSALLEDSTHLFLCDYACLSGQVPEPGRCRLVAKGKIYRLLQADNPMGHNHHWELQLQYLEGDG